MPETGMDYWVIIGVVVAIIAAYLTWKGLRKSPDRPVQNMTRTKGSTQDASGQNIEQNMKDVTDGEQKG